jgi:hypothetical protein
VGFQAFLPSFNATVIISEVTVNWLCQSFGLTFESTDPPLCRILSNELHCAQAAKIEHKIPDCGSGV